MKPMKTVHVVVTSHFDIVWRHPFEWYRQRRKKTIDAAIELMERFPQFKYVLSQAAVLRMYSQDSPENFEKLKYFHKKGRFEIVGGMETLADQNLVHGESILRNIELGLKWVTLHFKRPKIAAFDDVFGMVAQIPQICRIFGYQFLRPGRMWHPEVSDLPTCFVWRAPDGSEIPVFKEDVFIWGFGDGGNPLVTNFPDSVRVKNLVRDLGRALTVNKEHVLVVICGEEHIPSTAIVESVLKMNRIQNQARFMLSTFDDYLKCVRLNCKNTLEGEFPFVFTGCYTSRIDEKLFYERIEKNLIDREKIFSLFKENFGSEEHWRKLFVVQFHDSLGGCHCKESRKYILSLMKQIEGVTPRLEDVLSAKEQSSDLFVYSLCELKGLSLPVKVKGLSSGYLDFSGKQHPVFKGRAVLELPGFCVKRCNFEPVRFRRSIRALPFIKIGIELRQDVGTPWTDVYIGRFFEKRPSGWGKGVHNPVFSMYRWAGIKPPAAWYIVQRVYHNTSLPVTELNVNVFWMGKGWSFWLILEPETGEFKDVALFSTPFWVAERKPYGVSENLFASGKHPFKKWAAFPAEDGFYVVAGNAPCGIEIGPQIRINLVRSPVLKIIPFFPLDIDRSQWCWGLHRFRFMVAKCAKEKVEEVGEALYACLMNSVGVAKGFPKFNGEIIEIEPSGCVKISGITPALNGVILKLYEMKGRQVEVSLKILGNFRAFMNSIQSDLKRQRLLVPEV